MYPIKIKNAKRNASGGIDCNIYMSEEQVEPWPFTASSADSADHGRQIYAELNAGVWGSVAELTDADVAQRKIEGLENERVLAIADADAVIRPLSDERDAGIISDDDLNRWKAWIVYRKALREFDVSKDEVAWPAKPE